VKYDSKPEKRSVLRINYELKDSSAYKATKNISPEVSRRGSVKQCALKHALIANKQAPSDFERRTKLFLSKSDTPVRNTTVKK
jgi:hypothetical protein